MAAFPLVDVLRVSSDLTHRRRGCHPQEKTWFAYTGELARVRTRELMELTGRLENQAQPRAEVPASITDHGPGTVLVRTVLLDTGLLPHRLHGYTNADHPGKKA